MTNFCNEDKIFIFSSHAVAYNWTRRVHSNTLQSIHINKTKHLKGHKYHHLFVRFIFLFKLKWAMGVVDQRG